jgi:hypothetical protein
MSQGTMRPVGLATLLATLVLAAPGARAQLPKTDVPGASPAGADDTKRPTARAAVPLPTATADPNYPRPEPRAPEGEKKAEPLPGSGRQEPIPR